MEREKLTQKQELFCLAFIETGNASEAYRRSYSAKNMKPETVQQKASRLMATGKVRARVEELRAAAANQVIADEARVLGEACRIALLDPVGLFAEDGTLLPIRKMAPEVRAAIASVETEKLFEGQGKNRKLIGYTTKVKLWDKNSAIEKLLRNFGSFEKDNRQRATLFDGVSRDTVKMIMDRLKALRYRP